MPEVGRYGPTKVATTPLPGVRKQAAETSASTGADYNRAKANAYERVGDTGRQLANTFGQIAHEEKQRADESAVLNYETGLAKWTNERLNNPDTGALTVKGKDAMGLPAAVGQEFDDKASELQLALKSDDQRRAAARITANHAINLNATLERHVFEQRQKYDQEELASYVETAQQSAIGNASDPRRVGQELGNIVGAIERQGPRLGMGPEQLEEAKRKAVTAVHTGVIEQLLADDKDKAARAYFEETKGQISGESIAKMEKALDEGTLRGGSQREADAIIAAGGTQSEQLEKVRQIEDPKLRDATRERVEHEHDLADAAEREQEKNDSKEAFNIIDKTKDIRSIPTAKWANFSGATKESLRSYARQLAKGEPVTTDDPTFYALMRQAGEDPKMFVSQNLLDYKHKLDDSAFERLTGLQLSLMQGDAKASEKELSGFRTKNDILENTLTQYGIDPKAKFDTDKGKAIAQLQRMLDVRIEAAQSSGQKVTNTEIQQTLDELLSQSTTVPGSWWNFWPGGKSVSDTKGKLIETQPGDIPKGERAQIEAALRYLGKPINDVTVLNYYLEKQVRDSAR